MLCSLNRRDMKVGSVPLIGFPTGCVYRGARDPRTRKRAALAIPQIRWCSWERALSSVISGLGLGRVKTPFQGSR
jgi:hypothetical protein